MSAVSFRVSGTPVPQGSSRAYVAGGRARLVSTTSSLTHWRTSIATVAREAMAGQAPYTGPVRVSLSFAPRARPAAHYLPANRTRPQRQLRPDAPVWHTSAPDADKLARAALDAMTGVVFTDDRQVAVLHVTTKWPAEGQPTGVWVAIDELEDATHA